MTPEITNNIDAENGMPTESTTLVNHDAESPQSEGSGGSGRPQDADTRLWDEMDAPWPATFDRSISLLASPVIKAEKAKDFTKSPKPGNTPVAIRKRMLKRSNSVNTPEMQGLVPPRAGRRYYDNVDEYKRVGNMDFQSTKAHLKAQAKLVPLSKTQKDLELKSKDAAEYRKKILSKQQGGKKSERASSDKTTFSQCVFNLANILMGVGLLGLPFAFALSGYFGGSFAIISFALVCWKTSILIGRELNGDPRPLSYFAESPKIAKLPPGSDPMARMRAPIKSFPDIAREAFGNIGAVVLGIVLYFELFSCLAIFIVSIGDHMHELFPSVPVATHMIGFTFFSALPVIVLRTAGLLSYLSLVGTIATICVVLAVVFSFFIEGDITADLESATDAMNDTGTHHQNWNTGGLTAAFGLVAYCFSGHAIVPSIYNSMEKPYEFERVVDVTFIIVVAACLAIGLSGYTMFGDFVMDQITLSLNQHSSAPLAMDILTWLMILTAFSKLTLTMFPLAMGFEEIVAPYISSDSSMLAVGAIIKMVLLFGALAMALFVPSFSALCSMVGMICTMTVSVIFPAGAYLRLFWPKLSLMERVVYSFLVIAGIAMAVIGTALGAP